MSIEVVKSFLPTIGSVGVGLNLIYKRNLIQ